MPLEGIRIVEYTVFHAGLGAGGILGDLGAGELKIPGYPAHISANRAGTRSSAPGLGEHTGRVMQEMGFTDQEIQKFKKEGVIR